MRASEVLQRCLGDALGPMHALRARALLKAVEALTAGWRLTLIDPGPALPGAERVRAPLKAADRCWVIGICRQSVCRCIALWRAGCFEESAR